MTGVEEYRAWAEERTRRVLATGPDDRLIGMMVASADWRATIDGRAGGLSSAADRALLRAWRTASDLMLVGARTLELERYGKIIPDFDRDGRERRGMARVPRIVTISRSMDLDLDRVLEVDPQLALTVYSESPATPSDVPDTVEIVRLDDVSVDNVLADARDRYDAHAVVCEGGPTLLSQATQRGCLTDLSLTIAPCLVGGGLAVFTAYELSAPLTLSLVAAEVHDDSLFTHYAIGWSG